ncbi:hypothetical protein RUM43_003454, partial [Polyplax serrata]
ISTNSIHRVESSDFSLFVSLPGLFNESRANDKYKEKLPFSSEKLIGKNKETGRRKNAPM